jgi:hypothetical protein
MARQPRIDYEGAFYHVMMARGDRREPIVEDDEDRRIFLAAMGAGGKPCRVESSRMGAHDQSLPLAD